MLLGSLQGSILSWKLWQITLEQGSQTCDPPLIFIFTFYMCGHESNSVKCLPFYGFHQQFELLACLRFLANHKFLVWFLWHFDWLQRHVFNLQSLFQGCTFVKRKAIMLFHGLQLMCLLWPTLIWLMAMYLYPESMYSNRSAY